MMMVMSEEIPGRGNSTIRRKKPVLKNLRGVRQYSVSIDTHATIPVMYQYPIAAWKWHHASPISSNMNIYIHTDIHIYLHSIHLYFYTF